MKVMAITGDSTLSDEDFDRFLSRLARRAPDYFEVRDKESADGRVARRLRRAVEALSGSRVLANARFDLALAAGAAGVILPEAGLPIPPVRRETPRGFLIGRSTHSAASVAAAFDEGADLVLLGPIFETPSKAGFGRPLSPSVLDQLPERPPEGTELFLVGGIDQTKLSQLAPHRRRFTGVAAIRAFETSPDPAATVAAMKAL
ncbi:MAG: thiamine phosphate synthase [Thermoanaerobaculia bacterium]